jgi:hypothetical protein
VPIIKHLLLVVRDGGGLGRQYEPIAPIWHLAPLLVGLQEAWWSCKESDTECNIMCICHFTLLFSKATERDLLPFRAFLTGITWFN